MKLADYIATAWMLAFFMCVLLAPFVVLALLISYLWSIL